jgi:pimeloyl-ACP methyl ester carboxylesterase
MLKSFAGGAIFGETAGTGVPRVLALHGWRRERSDFGRTLHGVDALALDLPGFGASPPPPAAWGSAEYAAAVVPVLEEMEGPAVVLGHSFGGRVAVHLAASVPDRVGALVLTGVPNLVARTGVGRSRSPLGFRVARALHRRGLFPDARMEALRHRYGSADYRAATGVMRDVLVRVVNETYEDQLRAVRCPVELVWSDDDTAAPLDGAERAAALLGERATLTVLSGAGHLTPVTAPDELRAAVGRRLEAVR